MDLLRKQITELQTECAVLAGSRTARVPALLLLFAALIGGLAGAVGTWGFQHITAKTSKIGQIQAGRIPFDLFQETYKRGTVEFPVPFSKRPLVFVCEGGKPGAWITVKTDAISESMFVWATPFLTGHAGLRRLAGRRSVVVARAAEWLVQRLPIFIRRRLCYSLVATMVKANTD